MIFWGEPFPQSPKDSGRDHALDGTAKIEDFLDRPAGQVGVLGIRHDKKGLYFRRQLPVHQGKLELVLEIGKSTQTPDDDAALLPPHEIDE